MSRVVAFVLAWLGFTLSMALVSASPAFGEHEQEYCDIGFPKEQTGVAEPGRPGGRRGNFAWVRVVQPTPSPPSTAIIRSIYLMRGRKNFIEFGWKWNNDDYYAVPQSLGTMDPGPTVFVVKVIDGRYRMLEGSQGGGGNPENPGWGVLTQGSDYRFRIERNGGEGPAPRYRLERSDLLTQYLKHQNMPDGGHVINGSEAFAPCDSLYSEFHGLQKGLPIEGGGTAWTGWTDVHKVVNPPDNSKWWYFSSAFDVYDEYRLRHCATEDCDDQPDGTDW